jgi:hypothetical protein
MKTSLYNTCTGVRIGDEHTECQADKDSEIETFPEIGRIKTVLPA